MWGQIRCLNRRYRVHHLWLAIKSFFNITCWHRGVLCVELIVVWRDQQEGFGSVCRNNSWSVGRLCKRKLNVTSWGLRVRGNPTLLLGWTVCLVTLSWSDPYALTYSDRSRWDHPVFSLEYWIRRSRSSHESANSTSILLVDLGASTYGSACLIGQRLV